MDPRRIGSHLGGNAAPPGGFPLVIPSRGRCHLPMIGQQHRHSVGAKDNGGSEVQALERGPADRQRKVACGCVRGPASRDRSLLHATGERNRGVQPGSTSPKESVTKLTIDNAADPRDSDDRSLSGPAMESSKGGGKLRGVSGVFNRLVCRYAAHDWWALAYPPARRWECRRCGRIIEEAPILTPDRRRQPRTPTKSNHTGPG
jgi:hypothetical protein